MDVQKLIKNTKDWMRRTATQYEGQIAIELLNDEPEFLRFWLDTGHYLAELIVEPEGFHPYRHVAFTVLDTLGEGKNYAYCYYDEANETEEAIFEQLEEGIRFILHV